MAGKVFISFYSSDQAIAHAVKALLLHRVKTLTDTDVFISAEARAGSRWQDRIEEAMADAGVVVSIISRRSLTRPWIGFEAGAAWIRGIPLIPCCVGAQDVDTLPLPYSAFQAVSLPLDATKLASDVAHHLGHPPPPPPRLNLAALDSTPGKQGKNVFSRLADPYFTLHDAIETLAKADHLRERIVATEAEVVRHARKHEAHTRALLDELETSLRFYDR